jgi:hypothetical protein
MRALADTMAAIQNRGTRWRALSRSVQAVAPGCAAALIRAA